MTPTRPVLAAVAAACLLALAPLSAQAPPPGRPPGPPPPPPIVAASPEVARAVAERVVAELAKGQGRDRQAFFRAELSQRILDRNDPGLLAEYFDDMAELLGPTATPKVESVTPGNEPALFDVVARGGNADPVRLRFRIGGDPVKIDGIRRPAIVAPKIASLGEVAPAAERFVGRRAAEGSFSGAVLVAQHGRPIWGKAYGLADRATGRANTLETPINLGSMNKMFTAIAIAQQRAAGKLEWDDKVGKFLPDYPNAKVREQATIRQLLGHRSGIGSYWNPKFDAGKNQLRSLKDFFVTFADEPLLFEPGQGNEYSNGGPVVLGLILEKITGQSYYDYVRERIYQPAGMNATAHYPKDDPTIARGYFRPAPGGEWIANTEDLGRIGSSAGGGYSTANDLAAFAKALGEGKVLPKSDLEILWTPDDSGFYGFLWGTQRMANGWRWVGHSGGAPGINADFRYVPENGLVIIVLANQDRAAEPISEWLSSLLGSLPA